jgi:hypothetical protein
MPEKKVPVFRPDYKNQNPFADLPPDFPTMHSRFPLVPSTGYGGLSFVPPVGENGTAEENFTISEERLQRLRASIQAVVGSDESSED